MIKYGFDFPDGVSPDETVTTREESLHTVKKKKQPGNSKNKLEQETKNLNATGSQSD